MQYTMQHLDHKPAMHTMRKQHNTLKQDNPLN